LGGLGEAAAVDGERRSTAGLCSAGSGVDRRSADHRRFDDVRADACGCYACLAGGAELG
jgi:hypothetical protein